MRQRQTTTTRIIYLLSIILCLCVLSCGVQCGRQQAALNAEYLSDDSLEVAVLKFAENVLGDSLNVIVHDRQAMGYWDVQMIFEADDFRSDHFNTYTSYSDTDKFDKSEDENYTGVILFAATYKDVQSAEHAFQELNSSTQIRIADLEGLAGLLVEQVRIYEHMREVGGLLTQKGKFFFYLVENCGPPRIGKNWSEYEESFLHSITAEREEIEVINANCEGDGFEIQKYRQGR